MKTYISGDNMQALVIDLQGETIRAEAGAMLYKSPSIKMDAKLDGGLLGGLKRKLTGESLFIPYFTGTGQVAFAAPYPGHIVEFDLQNRSILCQRDAFLCATQGIDISIALTKKLGAGFFGGEGFILQKLTGTGKVWLHAGGNLIKWQLEVNQTMQIDTGCLVAFDESVIYDIQLAGDIKNVLFSGEGIFLTTVTGPGEVILQTLPFSRLADRIIAASHINKEESKGIGGILGDIISGDK
jgi:uncharacterized protein (TIGR00266 family)